MEVVGYKCEILFCSNHEHGGVALFINDRPKHDFSGYSLVDNSLESLVVNLCD